MIKTDILKKALLESTLKEIQTIEALGYPQVKTDDEYDNKIYNIISNSRVKSKHYHKGIVILVAAILVCLTTMMSISAIRIKVIDFVVSIYEKFVSISVDETPTSFPKTIETIYKPTYIPDDFKESAYIQDALTVRTIWDSSYSQIKFYQNAILDNMSKLDNESSSYNIAFVNDKKIFFILKNNEFTIKWTNNEYMFILICSNTVNWEEIEKIIMSVEKVSNE